MVELSLIGGVSWNVPTVGVVPSFRRLCAPLNATARNVRGYEVLRHWLGYPQFLFILFLPCVVRRFGCIIFLSYVLHCSSIALYYELYQPNCAGLRCLVCAVWLLFRL
jgi:hypothetical protein